MAETIPQLRKDIAALQLRIADLEKENARLVSLIGVKSKRKSELDAITITEAMRLNGHY